MAEKERIHIKMDIDDEVRKLLRDISAMDKESQGRLKDEVKVLSGWIATEIKRSAFVSPFPDQSAKLVPTVRAVKDRLPYVVVGGSAGRYSGGARSGQVLFGNEFGANPRSKNGAFPNGGRRFPYRSRRKGRGNEGYWIFPTVTALQPMITERWHDLCDHALANWKKGNI